LARPVIRALTKLATTPPRWRVVFAGDDRPIIVNTVELQSFDLLQRAAFAQEILFKQPVDRDEWLRDLRAVFHDRLVVEQPAEEAEAERARRPRCRGRRP
jgi:hypothetical protein